MSEEISWNEATKSGKFVTLEEGEAKKLVITNWKLEKVEKFDKEQIELVADILEEDGEEITSKDGKLFTTTSNRLKNKLRPLLEERKPTDKIGISIIKIGDKFNTNYSVKEFEIKTEAEKAE